MTISGESDLRPPHPYQVATTVCASRNAPSSTIAVAVETPASAASKTFCAVLIASVAASALFLITRLSKAVHSLAKYSSISGSSPRP